MTKYELQDIINNGGATLNKSGAAVNYSAGYQVSRRDCFIISARHTNKLLAAVNKLLVTVDASEFVGLWVDNGLVYIDVSERVERLSTAISLGIERKQKSIFDWCLSRCIGLEG